MVSTDTFYIKVCIDDILHQSVDEDVIVKGKCAIIIIRSLNLWVFLPLVAFMQ